MLMTPSKTADRQDSAKLPAVPEWVAVMHKDGAEAASARESTTKTRAWWDLVADMIVGRR